ncbi:hypothetical protein BOW27_11965, partial [Solemya velum gill symbiont]
MFVQPRDTRVLNWWPDFPQNSEITSPEKQGCGGCIYKMKIEHASLRVATVKIDPGVIVAHEDALKKGNDALYPF